MVGKRSAPLPFYEQTAVFVLAGWSIPLRAKAWSHFFEGVPHWYARCCQHQPHHPVSAVSLQPQRLWTCGGSEQLIAMCASASPVYLYIISSFIAGSKWPCLFTKQPADTFNRSNDKISLLMVASLCRSPLFPSDASSTLIDNVRGFRVCLSDHRLQHLLPAICKILLCICHRFILPHKTTDNFGLYETLASRYQGNNCVNGLYEKQPKFIFLNLNKNINDSRTNNK